MLVLTASLIRESEKNAVDSGIFSYRQLMENAGAAAAGIIAERFGASSRRITVVSGTGNNGGDGFVIARLLREKGARVTVVVSGKPKTEDAVYNFERLDGVAFSDEIPGDTEILVDALFGTGLDRGITGRAAGLIDGMNKSGAVKISVDLPSGVFTDSGRVPSSAVNADLTVTFIALKPALLLPPASDFCGEIAVADIGVAPAGFAYETIAPPTAEKRRRNSHKGSYGTALLICGSYGMAGAAILSARAALRGGAGIVKAAVCDKIYTAVTASVPEAVCIPLETGRQGTLCGDERIYSALSDSTAALIGCGLGLNDDTVSLVRGVIKRSEIPLVIDADGINAVAGSIDIIREARAPIILTPHPGEMARLCSCTVPEIEADRVGAARGFAVRYGCILVLKGANTVVALPDGRVLFNTTGNPGMATGGSGDVLAGLTVSLLAQGIPLEKAAASAVYLHGLAGDRAAEKHGERGMTAGDIAVELGFLK